VPTNLRFRITDNDLADGVIVRGAVLGLNSTRFLLEYQHKCKTKIAAKHKSEIVQKDLAY
jgi:hypothetical protein